ncbi:DUF6161 domain-containing protein [Litorimonas sp. WD9-15]|uniref:DUF6161 domain-containing protein n=1 Tax=Litorimonas sp. WD9-15 TaxID=3418716 RepID=UPI003CFFA482
MAEITLEFGSGKWLRERTFADAQAVQDWADKEKEAWRQFGTVTEATQTIDRLNTLSTTTNNMPDITEDETDDKLTEYLRRRNLQTVFSNIQMFRTDEEFQFVADVQKNHPDLVASFFRYFLHGGVDNAFTEQGILFRTLLSRRLLKENDPKAASQRAALEKLTEEYQNRLSDLDKKLADTRKMAAQGQTEERDRTDNALEVMSAVTNTQIEQSRSELNQIVDRLTTDGERAIEKINATDANFKEKLSLQPTVKYWTDKAAKHDVKARNLLEVLVFAAVVVGAAIFVALICLFAFQPELGKIGETKTLLTLGATGALTTLIFWAGRIITRIYLGNVHLANDARERATLINTYLALNVDEVATEQDRALVLATVFRPSTDGVVKDDAAPVFGVPGLIAGRMSGS